MKHRLEPDFSRSVETVAIGASAGGIDALFHLLGALQPSFRGTVVTVLHLPADHTSRLPEIFSHRIDAPVHEARPGEPIKSGCIYIAPPGYHLLVEQDRTFSLSCDPPVLFSRPSIDVLFQSCADVYGPELAGVVLTGANEDGAAGLAAVAAAGGLTAVQDPATAEHATMPEAAIRAAQPDYVLPLAELARLLQTVLR